MADTDTNTQPRTELKKRFDFMFKIVLLGDTEVGKTSLISRFVDDEFSSKSHPTIGVDFKLKILEIDGYLVKAQLWSTGGLEKYASASEMYYRGADAYFLVYDTTSRLSLNNTHRWLDKLGKVVSQEKKVPLVLVGSKTDLTDKREVSKEAGQTLAIQLGARWFETSSLNGAGVENLFREICSDLLNGKKTHLKKVSDMSSTPADKYMSSTPADKYMSSTPADKIEAVLERDSEEGSKKRRRKSFLQRFSSRAVLRAAKVKKNEDDARNLKFWCF